MKNEILEILYNNYAEYEANEEREQLYAEFVKSARTYIKDIDASIELEDLANEIEYLASKHYFEAGFKYGLEIAKMFVDSQSL